MPDDDRHSAILCFDFDGTLVDRPSDPYDIARLEEFLKHMHLRGAIWGINTGRSLYHTLDGLTEHGFRQVPDFIIARECEIYHRNDFNRCTKSPMSISRCCRMRPCRRSSNAVSLVSVRNRIAAGVDCAIASARQVPG